MINQLIAKTIEPLNHFVNLESSGLIKAFYHDITYGDGEIDIITNDFNVSKFYHNKKFPAVCVNQNGRNLSPGFYLKKHLCKTSH